MIKYILTKVIAYFIIRIINDNEYQVSDKYIKNTKFLLNKRIEKGKGKMKKDLVIQNLRAESGNKIQGFVKIINSDEQMPVTLINGCGEGKTILITAGVHACEYPGIQTATELAKEIDPKDVNGNIIIVNIVNMQGFVARSAGIVPEDNENINRVFPGDKNKSLAHKIAYTITHEFQDISDFYLDLHGGDLHENLNPYVYYPGIAEESVIEESRKVAEVLNVEYMVRSSATSGAYNSAAIRGIPSLLIERGGCGLCPQDLVREYKRDVIKALRKLKVIDGFIESEKKPHELDEAIYYIDSNSDGLWIPSIKKGERVKKGQVLGTIRDYFGNYIETYYAESDAIILYYTEALSVTKGSSLIAYGEIQEVETVI